MSSSQSTGSGLGQQAKDAGAKAQQGASDAANKTKDAGYDAANKARDAGHDAKEEASSALHKADDKADKTGAQAEKKVQKKKSGGDKGDKDKLKVAGAVVAVGAALVFGGVKVYRSRQEKEEPKKGKLEEKASGFTSWFNKKADQADKNLDGKGTETKNKAAELTDSVVSTVKTAADKTGLSDVGHSVSHSTKGAREKISDVGLKIEEKGLKASQDSDRAVRDAYAKAADRANQVSGSGSDSAKRGKEKSGNLFDSIGNWLNDRKDDASHAASSAKKQVQDTGKKGKK